MPPASTASYAECGSGYTGQNVVPAEVPGVLMSKSLIVNADDFGLTRNVNQAIVELHRAGAVTSATLMARGAAFEHAVELAKAHPTLGVGCHVVLTDGTPVSPPQTIPTLLGADGRSFRASLQEFLLDVLRGRVKAAELEREIVAQIEELQLAGLHVTHLDTHKHTHVLPAVARALLRAAEATGVRAVRTPFEEPWSLRLGQTRSLRVLAVAGTHLFRSSFLALPQIASGRVRTTDGTIGISATGHLNAGTLERILNEIPDGTWELVCHPGYHDRDLDSITTRLRGTREIEREALLHALAAQPPGRVSGPQLSAGENSSHRPLPELIHYGRLAERINAHAPLSPTLRDSNAESRIGTTR